MGKNRGGFGLRVQSSAGDPVLMAESIDSRGGSDEGAKSFGCRWERRLKMASFQSIALQKDTEYYWGWFFVIISSLSLLGFLYAAVVSKLLPPSENPIVSAIQKDWYYCLLVPLTMPILMVAVYFHWLSMKLFKHA